MEYVTVYERWYVHEERGQRKIGDGPWEEIDLSPWGGRKPVVFLRLPEDVEWFEEERLVPKL